MLVFAASIMIRPEHYLYSPTLRAFARFQLFSWLINRPNRKLPEKNCCYTEMDEPFVWQTVAVFTQDAKQTHFVCIPILVANFLSFKI